jgi:hypothetical protein
MRDDCAGRVGEQLSERFLIFNRGAYGEGSSSSTGVRKLSETPWTKGAILISYFVKRVRTKMFLGECNGAVIMCVRPT